MVETIEKKCLKCGGIFKAKKDTAKYCSVSCRVMFNRKPKVVIVNPDLVTPLQMQVLYNSVLEMVGKINYGQVPTISDAPRVTDLIKDEPKQWEEPLQSIQRKPKSVIKYISERLDIDCAEDYEKWLQELDSDPYLSERDKNSAKTSAL